VIVALVNNKGGVGKTTTAVNLAAVLAERHGPVLLVDLDSQASASVSLGVDRHDLVPSVAQALLYRQPIERAIRRSGIDQLDLLTGSLELASTDVALAEVPNREHCLRSVLDQVRDRYDLILLDTPPSLSLLGINALAACDAFVVPVVPQYLALEGLVSFLDSVETLTERLKLKLEFGGVMLTMVDPRSKAAREISELIRGQYRHRVFHTEIPLNVRLAEAPSFGRTILSYAPRSAPADAYRRAAGELLTRLAS
jgi:chromosome partitioning protein